MKRRREFLLRYLRLLLFQLLPFHNTISVPTGSSVNISKSAASATRPSTKETFPTPDRNAATALSTLGIIPRSITPDFFKSSTSSAARRGISESGFFGSRNTPGTSLIKTSRSAFKAMAACAAATSALQL